MRTILAAFFAVGLMVQAAAPLPREAPEFTFVEPSGKKTQLSSLKGQVVCIQFLDTTCPHCQAAAGMLSKLQAELGPSGFRVFGVAFNGAVNTPENQKNALVTADFQQRYARFPVAMAPRDQVLKHLGLSVMEQFYVPQIMLIDRKGVIRYQDKAKPDGQLSTEASLRKLVAGLLSEPGPGASKAPTQSKAKPAAGGGIKQDK
jgi:peroxiredoxin